jgi:hypothetical protein
MQSINLTSTKMCSECLVWYNWQHVNQPSHAPTMPYRTVISVLPEDDLPLLLKDVLLSSIPFGEIIHMWNRN